MHIIGNFVSHKLRKSDYKLPPWINHIFCCTLRKRVNLRKLTQFIDITAYDE